MIVIVIVLYVSLYIPYIKNYLINNIYEKDLTTICDNYILFNNNRYIKSIKLFTISLVLLLLNNSTINILVLLSFIISYKLEYIKLKSKYNKQLSLLQYTFPIWLRQLQILLNNNNVINALEVSLDNAPDILRIHINKLIVDIKNDPITIDPYLNFMNTYRLNEIERSMKLLYRYNNIGSKDNKDSFNKMISSTNKWLRSSRKDNYDSKLSIFKWWGMLPLVGLTLVYMCIMFTMIVSLFESGVV